MRLFVYLLLFGSIVYLLWTWGRRQQITSQTPGASGSSKPRNRFRAKRSLGEPWVQVYETASMDEAKMLQARLQEEEIECVLYEQGKKDIHGNSLKGIGVAVPKSTVPHAQNIISRMPV